MQTPGTTSARTAVDVRVNVVVAEYVTVASPFGPVTIRLWPLTCTSWPFAPLRSCAAPPRAGLGDDDALLAAVGAAPQATAAKPAIAVTRTTTRFTIKIPPFY
jgi:hypothetical protein